MEAVEAREEWSLFCPHEVKKIMGWKDENGRPLGLEDFYDQGQGEGEFRQKYAEAVANPAAPHYGTSHRHYEAHHEIPA